MGHHKHFYLNQKYIRDRLNLAVDIADEIHAKERELIRVLHEIDQERFYIRYGLKSLSGFCLTGLKFSKTQTQRIVTQVRRYIPTSKIMDRCTLNKREFQ